MPRNIIRVLIRSPRDVCCWILAWRGGFGGLASSLARKLSLACLHVNFLVEERVTFVRNIYEFRYIGVE